MTSLAAGGNGASLAGCLSAVKGTVGAQPVFVPGSRGSRILLALETECQSALDRGNPSEALSLLTKTLRENDVPVHFHETTITLEELKARAEGSRPTSGLAGHYLGDTYGADHPKGVHLPELKIKAGNKELSLHDLTDAPIAKEKPWISTAVRVMENALYRKAHEEAFHAAQYDGGNVPAGNHLPLTEKYFSSRPEEIQSLKRETRRPTETLKVEIEYLEYQLLRNPAKPIRTEGELGAFLDAWAPVRGRALAFFVGTMEFQTSAGPELTAMAKKAVERPPLPKDEKWWSPMDFDFDLK